MNVEIVNNGKESFGFVPIFAQVTNAEGKKVSSQFISASGKNVVNAGETAKGTLSVFKPAFRSYFPEKEIKTQNLCWETILGVHHEKITIM